MIATVADSTRGQTADPGHAPTAEALLVEQLAHATRQLRVLEFERRRTDVARSVIRSLRKTLSWIAEHGSVLDPSASDFVIKVSPNEGPELWYRGRRIPICPQPLREALELTGLELEPGQVLLSDQELARRIVEESLVRYSLEEFRLREMKSALLRTLEEASDPRIRALGPA